MSRPEIEFWFDFGSTYSYLSTMRIEHEASLRGLQLRWKPFMLGAVFKALGWHGSPFAAQTAKGRHMWKDMARQCAKFGLAWRQPSSFPRRAVLPHRVVLLAEKEPWVADFCRAVMERNFVHDQDIDGTEAVSATLTSLGLPAREIIKAAEAPWNKQRLREQTDDALERGIFGAPTFFVGDEMFWGNDRMDDAMDLAQSIVPPGSKPPPMKHGPCR